MSKKLYLISLDGCDDGTDFEMELTTEQYMLLCEVSQLSKAKSHYYCMPTMSIEEVTKERSEEYDL